MLSRQAVEIFPCASLTLTRRVHFKLTRLAKLDRLRPHNQIHVVNLPCDTFGKGVKACLNIEIYE